ncbi:MAG: type 2 lantipeptide synthetase LanM family protein [Gomphosphaeria aponina SAG 52.96 = DSM 107014]|uniref:Type 2 lantipeptide synthetase LanM family protein n=1 Tax=Gomphosphaeria aponina SAG 52.96 = DSM 107014 TaxID=1521640 RepID=A0A941JS48_9CHRO|nr:type 2 lantipeptide synthetase LanM family protein [Gomphosphaeria aponina SAG 52.96 = DSM 107014]
MVGVITNMLKALMNKNWIQKAAWYEGLTLRERTKLRPPNYQEFDQKKAERRLKKWRSQTPFNQDYYYEQRLLSDGLTNESFTYLLGEKAEALKKRASNPPDWLIALEKAFSQSAIANNSHDCSSLVEVVQPLIKQGFEKLQKGLDELSKSEEKIPFEPNTIKDILAKNLPNELLGMLNQTMALELNVARLQGLLAGETPEERFRSFVARLSQPEAMVNLLQEYPVLARQLVIFIEQWVNFNLEFLNHLVRDWSEICQIFSPETEPGVLVEIKDSQGDSHRGGRSVIIAKFSGGLELVYKPKSLTIDGHFQELLIWLNSKNSCLKFKTLKIIKGAGYGWVIRIKHSSCQTQGEVQGFYQRMGGYLALLYALEATDFHAENIIAASEYPMLIDLESLFQPHLGGNINEQKKLSAAEAMGDSVLRVGILPQKVWGNEAATGIDFSAIGATPEQIIPKKMRSLAAVGSDEMRITRKQMKLKGAENLPQLNVNVLDYAEEIVKGFREVYHCLMKEKEELLGEKGLINKFATDEIRVILRSSATYALLLGESYHPDVLRNGLERDRLFDKLWVDVEHFPELAQVIPGEKEDLWCGDIPMFTTAVNSRDLVIRGNQRLTNFLAASGLELVKHRLQRLDEKDLERQIWFIKASLSTISIAEEPARWKGYKVEQPEREFLAAEFMAAACEIGDRLELLALGNEEEATWIGLSLQGWENWQLTSLNWTLYDGLPGVILFLAYLGEISEEKRYTKLAQRAFNTLQFKLKKQKNQITNIGGFSGWGGIIYTLTHLATLWQQPQLLNLAIELVKSIEEMVKTDEYFDIISGAAGYIGSLLALNHCVAEELVKNTAIECGDRLLFTAETTKEGLYWQQQKVKNPQTTGFAHGAAGIAWALLQLGELTERESFYQAGVAAIAYERNKLSGDTKNPIWCNGITGIGLARLAGLKYLNDSQTHAEINTAMEIILERGWGLNHSLCHGDLGNLELLLQAREILKEAKLEKQINYIAAMILESSQKNGWLCGTLLGVETPGLMIGLAGIGYGLLRLAQPQRVPNVLLLEPPVI